MSAFGTVHCYSATINKHTARRCIYDHVYGSRTINRHNTLRHAAVSTLLATGNIVRGSTTIFVVVRGGKFFLSEFSIYLFPMEDNVLVVADGSGAF